MPIHAISSIWYPVTNWEAAKNFYSKALGLNMVECDDEAGWAAFQIEQDQPSFFLVLKPEMDGGEIGGVVTFEATEIQRLLDNALEFGGEVEEEVQDGDDVRIFTLYDPDGNMLELAEVIQR